jgi:hypothetical protein
VAVLTTGCTPRSSATEVSAAVCPIAPHTTLREVEGILDPTLRGRGSAFICGFSNPEDIVPIGDTRWLVASSYAGLGAAPRPGRLYLIDATAKDERELFPGASPDLRLDAAMYPTCPGLDLSGYDTLGLSAREKSPGIYRLYATSHGAVEAIQAFEIDARGTAPKIAWVGCVPLPPNVWANSVTILEDGGFVVTQYFDPSDTESVRKAAEGVSPGALYRWHPGGAVTLIPGSAGLTGANGIEASPDGRYIFVNTMPNQVVRFDMNASPPAKVTLSLPIVPDNLRWTPTGDLLTVGSEFHPSWICRRRECTPIYRIDPDAMTATFVANSELTAASTALQVGDKIWIGAAWGDRVAYMRAY